MLIPCLLGLTLSPSLPALHTQPLAVRPGESPAEEAAEDTPGTLWEALLGGKSWVKLRYRFEAVDDDDPGRPDEGYASTLRTVLGYETAPWHGFSALLEFENVTVLGDDEAYDDTINGETSKGVVADPESTEVNQVFLRYAGSEMWGFELGRQRLILDNHRFVGNVGWRQNEQTMDAATVHSEVAGFDLFYSFVANVNRVFGDDSPMGDFQGESHLINAGRDLSHVGRGSVYAYLLEFEDADTLSTVTFGGRLVGSHDVAEESAISWEAEFASQSDWADNPNDVSANYYHGALGFKTHGVAAKVGLEVLEGGDPGDGDKFTTPLATLHKFNGWADQFLATPDTGLEDLYASLGAGLGKADFLAVYHMFEAESGGSDYGSEIDILLGYPVHEHVKVGIKFASYFEDGFDDDIQKLWIWASLF